MDCAAAGPLLAAHGDGALGPVDRAAVQGHLASCDDCRDLAATIADRIGRLEAVLAGYRPRLAAVEPHLEVARGAIGGRPRTVDLAALAVIGVLAGPGLLDAMAAAVLATFGWRLWWWADSQELALGTLWCTGTAVPALAAAQLAVAWRRLRREAGHETGESLLLAGTAAVAALLAWWPLVGVCAQSTLRFGALGAADSLQAGLAHTHALLGLVALLVATLAAAPMVLRPARRADPGHPAAGPERHAVRVRMEDALRLLALACFERGADLLEAARVAEDEMHVVAARLGEANQAGVTLRSWTVELAGDLVPAAEAPAAERATMRLRKVAERRELEATLHRLAPESRAATYLRCVLQVPLPKARTLLGLTPEQAAQALADGVTGLGAFAHPSTSTSTLGEGGVEARPPESAPE